MFALPNHTKLNMPQVSKTVRMDAQLKKTFDSLCAQFGMSANTAINVFAKAVVQRRCIPFEIKANDEPMDGFTAFREIRKMAESGQLPDMSLDEINNEIKKSRISRQ